MVQRLTAAAERSGLPELERAAEAERAVDLITHGANAREAGRWHGAVWRRRPPTRRGRVPARCRSSAEPSCGIRTAPGTRRRTTSTARPLHLEEAARLFVQVGHRERRLRLAPYRALRVELALGHPGVALEILDEALALVVERPRRTATILGYRGEVLVELGRYDQCEAGCREVLRIAEQLGEPHCYQAAFAEWLRMEAASRLGRR